MTLTMKRRLIILLAALPLAAIALHGQDYYSGKDTVRTSTASYKVIHYDDYISVQNVNNVRMLSFQYDTKTGELLSMAQTGFPRADPDKAMFAEILKEVFTEEEIARYSQNGNNGMGMYFVIEPKTGKTLEVEFELNNSPHNHNPILLSIPVCKLERLETLMKEKLIWKTPHSDCWKNVSDIRAPYGYF